MKKKSTFIPYKIILSALFLTIATPTALCASASLLLPPAPVGLEEAPALGVDLYMIPMIIIAILFAFFFIRKNTRV